MAHRRSLAPARKTPARAKSKAALRFPPPSTLKGDGLRLWNELVPLLESKGRLIAGDTTGLEILCMTYKVWRDCAEIINKAGTIYKTSDRSGNMLFKSNPAAMQMSNAARTLDIWCSHFQLTPMSRSRAGIVELPEPTKEDLDFDKMRGRRR